jgi:D,D-heptose 1,7-bisphosphate phosphatase
MKQAIILAGGKGTRLQSRLNGLPKPLIDIAGKPLLERQIELLMRYGFDEVLILVNHAADQIAKFIDSKKHWPIRIECIDDGEPLGTAGATIAIYPKLQENFLVVYGDTMLDIDLERFEKFHLDSPLASATLFLHPNDHPQDSDLVEINRNNIIEQFYPYPHPDGAYLPNLVNAGLYWIRKDAIDIAGHEKKFSDFGKDFFPQLIERDAVLKGYNSPEYIKDCGTPSRLDKVCAHLLSGRIASQNLNNPQAAIFIDRDGVINEEMGRISKHENFHLTPGSKKAIKAINESNYRAVLVTNQPVIARGDCSEEDLKNIHNKMEALLGASGAYLDRIEYCPHHPDKGFPGERAELKIECNCRKPAIGMIEKAQKELNIDLRQSWFIGDSTADMLAASTAGIRSILVQTGHAGLDEKYPVLPDYICPNFESAIHFILSDYPQIEGRITLLNLDIQPGNWIFVGGLSRSGKSTFANCLKYYLQNQGLDAKVIALDGWLKPKAKRGNSVMERYDQIAIQAFINSLTQVPVPSQSSVPLYSKKKEFAANHLVLDNLSSDTVFIVEGTIALHFAQFLPKSRMKTFFIDIEEVERKNRVLAEYATRGKTVEEAFTIYNDRMSDESPIILQTRTAADYCVQLHLGKPKS